MSSNIRVQRICKHCGSEFTARTTVTQYCNEKCSRKAYKERLKSLKITISDKETLQVINQPIAELKAKEFLTVREVSKLLSCSVRSAYYYIENGTIKAVNLGQRITRVKRSEIDKLFEQPQTKTPQPLQMSYDISECYTLKEVMEKFSISEKGLHDLIKRKSIPKIKKGRYAYVPKPIIDKYLN